MESVVFSEVDLYSLLENNEISVAGYIELIENLFQFYLSQISMCIEGYAVLKFLASEYSKQGYSYAELQKFDFQHKEKFFSELILCLADKMHKDDRFSALNIYFFQPGKSEISQEEIRLIYLEDKKGNGGNYQKLFQVMTGA